MVNISSQSEEAMDDTEEDDEGGIRIGDIYIPPPPLPACTFDTTGPRLIINDIIIENFKSYGGKVSLGPFQKNFSAIIGPNGSGKSNVIDSMLFVFGYRAQKIRSKTVGVLIHSSDKYPNLTSCKVTVHFQKIIDRSHSEFDVIEGSEFVVSRTANKDNSSFYAINGRRVQFKEVSRLLRSHGIDLDHNRFLILQGEVEQISLMKPKAQTEHDTGLLEFLEDIIGSGRFKEPTQQLAAKVDELNEQRSEKLNRVKTVEKEKDELESAKETALEYIRTKNKIALQYNIIHQCQIHNVKINIEELDGNKKTIEEDMSDLFAKVKETDEEFKAKTVEMEKLDRKLESVLKKVEAYELQFAELDKQDTRCRQDLKNSSGRRKELVGLLNKEKEKLEDLLRLPDKLTSEIVELQRRRVRLEDDKAKQVKAFDEVMLSLHSETKTLREQKEPLETELMALRERLNPARSKVELVQLELDLYLKNEWDEKIKLSNLQETYTSLQNCRLESEREIQNLSRKLPKLEKAFQNTNHELEAVSAQETSTTEELHEQRIKVEEAKANMRTMHSRGRLLEALMQAKNSGRIPGIIGRLGDLGAIDEKYDVAISTACGQLDNIVTDTLDTAQECIKLMKRQNLGQATFIGLDKMQVWQAQSRQKISTPQNVPRLFDLVKVRDEIILPAFYFALRDTLVADNISQATEIGLRGRTRHRVVTLNGELIETSGTMSGGGSRPIRGRMGSSVVVADTHTPEQIQDMEAAVGVLQDRMVQLRTRKSELEELLRQQRHDVDECHQSLRKYKLDLEALTRDEPVIRKNLQDQEVRTKAAVPDKKRVQQLTDRLDKCKQEFHKLEDAASVLEAKVQRIDDEMKEISGGRMQAAKKKVDDVTNAIDAVDGTITKDEVALKTARRSIIKTETKIKDSEAEQAAVAETITNLKAELVRLEGMATDVNDKSHAEKEKAKGLEEQVVAARAEVKSINKVKSQLDSQKLDVNHQLNDLDTKIKKCASEIKVVERKLSALSLERVDNDEGEGATLPKLSVEELETTDRQVVEFKVIELQRRLQEMNPNVSAIAEFKRKEDQYLQRVNDLDEVTRNRDAHRQHHENLRKQRLNEFMEGFQIISHKLKETYQMLTLGGDAELELVNSLDPFSDGIVFSVRPPRKSWKNISNLSGGEKTLSSLALVFALHYYKPTPFYVMDEIDAALDFRNVSIVAHYIKEQTKNAQFIVISLRNHLFEMADRLIGIFKTYNTSHSISVEPTTEQQPNEEPNN